MGAGTTGRTDTLGGVGERGENAMHVGRIGRSMARREGGSEEERARHASWKRLGAREEKRVASSGG